MPMKISVGSRLRITDPSTAVLAWCKENLVLPNPEYAKKSRMGFWVGDTPKEIKLMEFDGDELITPYGCLEALLRLDECQVTSDIPLKQKVLDGPSVPLYSYQTIAVKEMLNAYYGILQSPAGSGKTQMGIALACEIGTRTLWLTHTKDLLSQSKARAEKYIDPRLLGTITEGTVHLGKAITFATVQTMSRLDLSLYRNTFDTIIVDECHRVCMNPTAVTQFSKVLNNLAARHKYGLTATAHRADGMIAATYALLGPVRYAVPKEAVRDTVMDVSILPRPTHETLMPDCLDTDGTVVYAKLINSLTRRPNRNTQISIDLYKNAQHYNLILSDRIDHLKTLMRLLPEGMREQAVMVDGKMTSKSAKAEREAAIQEMRDGKKHYLFATYALAKEGLDIPRLDRLYLTTPQKDFAVITQSIGRIARVFPGKNVPIAYDYVDDGVQTLVRSFKKRCATYRKLGCAMIEE